MTRAIALGRLLRLSLAPSAVADVVVGAVLGAGGTWPAGPAPWLAIAASLAVYHGGMALNDWADRDADGLSRPDRPIPSGAVPAGVALALASALLALGVAAAAAAAPRAGVWYGALVVTVAAYDLGGRGPWLGPALLGLARFANLGAGLSIATWTAGAGLDPRLLAPAVLYGVYVFAVSRLGRLEDREDPRPLGARPRHALLGAAAALAAVPLLAAVAPVGAGPWGVLLSAAVALAAASGLARRALGPGDWTRGRVGAAMGPALRRLLAFTAACALLAAGRGPAPLAAAAVALAGAPASYALRRVFPPS